MRARSIEGHSCSNTVLCPNAFYAFHWFFVRLYTPCWLHTWRTCVIPTCRLGLVRSPLVARNNTFTVVLSPRWAKLKSRQVSLTSVSGCSGADLGGGCKACAPPPPEMTCGFLIQLAFCQKKNQGVYWCWSRARRRVHPLLKKILDPPLMFLDW